MLIDTRVRRTFGWAAPERILADLWRRLGALDTSCDITIVRQDANRPGHQHTLGKSYAAGGW